MAWTRGLLAALVGCVLLLTGSAGCGSSDGREQNNQNNNDGENGESLTPVGKLLDDTDEEGRRFREVDDKSAPEVGIQVQPAARGDWGVRLTLHRFRFSPAGVRPEATVGRGVAQLFLNDRLVARLRTPEYRLAAALVPRGTHHVTARLYADDGTVWAVDGKPVESTADITASSPEPTATDGAGGTPARGASGIPAGTPADGADADRRTEGRGSPDRAGRASWWLCPTLLRSAARPFSDAAPNV
ncbi:hypothetical protein [Streptomyces sp. TRM68367]|uniref:hypothetical protein n=1 Tax=Streptomyces sp. TRM68367 TaxID=2758415 RepID=UPI0021D18F7E|nr:hypothetical protein [Streptomyces sp. TRM68367]